ncbi:MAG TPA: glycosyltransferase [Acetobacteraceae bacterium]|nr:glycosyltransferase [Acetobacteraceae bacterium]
MDTVPARHTPAVDVNLFVFNGAETIAAAIESVLAQTWPALTLTVIDDGSTDDTLDVVRGFIARHPAIRLKRNRVNGGAVANFQRAFWLGDADFVLPKSADDVIDPRFVEQAMAVLLAHPDCAMCHAAGLVFTGEGDIRSTYPPGHRLSAVGADPLARARHVMATYTSSPSFWGVYRRSAVDRLARIGHRAGWDHALLAELALYGEIRHVPELLYWRRDGGKPVLRLARAATEAATRGLPLDGPLAEHRWRTPLITTAYAHIETFAVARIDETRRRALMQAVPGIFRARWLSLLRREAAVLERAVADILPGLATEDGLTSRWIATQLSDAVRAVEAIVPEAGLSWVHAEIAALSARAPAEAEPA